MSKLKGRRQIDYLVDLHSHDIIVDYLKNLIFEGEYEALHASIKNEFKRCLKENPNLATKYCRVLIQDIFNVIEHSTDFCAGEYSITEVSKHENSWAFEVEFFDHLEKDENGEEKYSLICFLVDPEGV